MAADMGANMGAAMLAAMADTVENMARISVLRHLTTTGENELLWLHIRLSYHVISCIINVCKLYRFV